ncbi:hypothetical protein PYW07_012438 [Mythimna separata]|uniref:Uncharacterized protein n=1 Tax=Mythimna separata TaxID=271217 RepID=A0AAD7YM82_MYTSE|nr:hypothetical protein PYW07_012438 [Mythimna separata]
MLQITFNSKGSYIVICDETILGVEVAGWLIKGGVRKVILHQENANESAYYQARRNLKKLCNNVKPNTSTVKGLKAFYNYIEVNEIFAGEPIIILPSQIANCIDKHVKETFKFNSKFYILGYSFGVNIALEMAAMLEKEGTLNRLLFFNLYDGIQLIVT